MASLCKTWFQSYRPFDGFQSYQPLEGYATLADYLSSDQLPVYESRSDDVEPVLIGRVARQLTTTVDAHTVQLTLTYPKTVLPACGRNHYLQFNGTDIYLSVAPPAKEHFYVPMPITLHVGGQTFDQPVYHMPIQYGQDQVVHILPCQELAEAIIADVNRQQLAFAHSDEALRLSHWNYDQGRLEVYGKLPETICSTLEVHHPSQTPSDSSTGDRSPVDHYPIRYRPQVTYCADAKDDEQWQYHLSDKLAQQIIAEIIDQKKYHVNYRTMPAAGRDLLYAEVTIRTEDFPKDQMQVLQPFIHYLQGDNVFIDEEQLYDYFLTQKLAAPSLLPIVRAEDQASEPQDLKDPKTE